MARIQGREWRKVLKDFLFHYRTIPNTVTGLRPARLLMGREPCDKIPKLEVAGNRASETDWQDMLRIRDFQHKLRQKEYADAKRDVGKLYLEAGDTVLLKQRHRQNKLGPSFEPDPYRIVHQERNAVVLQNSATRWKQ